ncbi:MAG: helix-turn-helix transcriptional regulator [Proteobacteria bacterium]|nr:helix-turn-helix transcriptional regulator [Pseudomonadota bacterium]
MSKIDLNKQFAFRLRDAMLAAGFHSERSISGISIHKLSEITGYSLQICRKYLRGEAIPEPAKLVEIAEYLKVAPGWLLFGDNYNSADDKIMISKELLNYILNGARHFYKPQFEDEATQFLFELIKDVSQIIADDAQSKKIVDLALSSTKYLMPKEI